MSFLSVIGSIGHVLGVGTNAIAPFAPIISAIPGFGPIFNTALQSIVAVESIITTANSGAVKKTAAMQLINAVHPGLDQAKLGEVIDGIVAGFNLIEQAMSKLPAPVVAAAA